MMQFRDLAKQYQILKADIDNAMLSVASGAHYIMGPQVKELEQHLAEYVGVKHCLTCANGTDALTLALKAFGIGPGDAVFVPDFTFFASAEVVALEGATPVFVDVDDTTFNIDVDSLEKAISQTLAEGKLTPKVIIAVDLFGLPANYPAVKAVAQKYGLLILEDGAQGFGGSIHGQKACSFGDIATTSFFPAKPLGCYGDGGAVFTDDDEVDARLRSLRAQGKSPVDKYDNREIGMNSRLDTIQAAILLPKFKAFVESELAAVNQVADWYTDRLSFKYKTPTVLEGFYSSWAQYTILLTNRDERDAMQAKLKGQGIPSMIYYPRGLHQQEAYRGMMLSDEMYPCTIDATNRCLSLPMHPYMTKADVDLITKNIID